MKKPLFDPKEIIPKFDEFLTSKQLKFDGIAIGGNCSPVGESTRRKSRLA